MRRRAALALTVLAVAGCGGDDETSPEPATEAAQPPPSDSRCVAVTTDLMTPLANLLTDKSNRLTSGQAVKSRDHERIYFVSAEIDGPGLADPGDIGTWATSSLHGGETIYAVDELANEHSDWRDGKAANLSMADDGAQESRRCVGR
jgi:hypothetical protein